LVRAGEKDIDSIMAAVKDEFIKWSHSPENNRAPGNACLKGVSNLEKEIHWSKSGVPDSKGCGSAMRSAPIGYLYQQNPEKLREVAHATGICTHGHPTADAASIGAAYLVKLALDGIETKDMIPQLLKFTSGISSEFDQAILKINTCIKWDEEEQALDYLGEGWVGEEAVTLALYCFMKYPDNYKRTVTRAANTNGDSDSIACIAGSISGAYLGIDAIPAEWVCKIEKAQYLTNLSVRLAEKRKQIFNEKSS
jgi:ADP-ribosylglycohydrolase